jgi:nicotinate-nucleotide pyrophosphorylase (carboxylating)
MSIRRLHTNGSETLYSMIFPLDPYTDEMLKLALSEDIGTGDITTNTVVPATNIIYGSVIAKEDGVICGLDVFARVFFLLDKEVRVSPKVSDGDTVTAGTMIAEIEGLARSVLTGERVALNLLQRLSGIATKTNELVRVLAGTKTKVIDTRKTSPGLRVLEKYAVRTGGGSNHRMNLSDGILIKDNHIKAAGSIERAVAEARANCPATLKIEVEVESIDQVKQALKAKADIIMLDNMSVGMMTQAVSLIGGKALTEASGNMNDRDLVEVASTGVNFISVGALTHSVKALDISLKFL